MADWILKFLKIVFTHLGLSVTRLSEQDRRYIKASYDKTSILPEGACKELRNDNPRLQSLRQAYRGSGLPVVQHSLWAANVLGRELKLPWFRGDNAYVWQFRQLRSQARIKQYLTLLDTRQQDAMGLLEKLDEDGLFGCWTFRYADNKPVSRDLLDSIREINYLERKLLLSKIPDLKVLDIGAGYGRLAHRMCAALPNITVYDCVDAVPESTFLCDYYLRFRGLKERAHSIPLTDLADRPGPVQYHLAVNIHSFTECTREAIVWWLDYIAQMQIPHLLIIPNDTNGLLSSEIGGRRIDCTSEPGNAGYELMCRDYVVANSELRKLIGVNDMYFLYRLSKHSS